MNDMQPPGGPIPDGPPRATGSAVSSGGDLAHLQQVPV
jgi:hypothetical protein